MKADPTATARFLGAFFDELYRLGVRDVVVSPGSRSTPLAMVAFEMSQRQEFDLRLFLDVDERGAAFFALGRAKATHRPACVICTSGTATANFFPAVLEAESSRVPLVVLTGDRPPRLQGLGAPQTCDQLKLYGDHVRLFRQMPLPENDATQPAFARQVARESYAHAMGPAAAYTGGPVHINFPFEEPLKPDMSVADLFEGARSLLAHGASGKRSDSASREDEAPSLAKRDTSSKVQHAPCTASQIPGVIAGQSSLALPIATQLLTFIRAHQTALLVGEGIRHDERGEGDALLDFAKRFSIPVLADPLSNVRACDASEVISAYDAICKQEDVPLFDLIIRIGRYPISKSATQRIEQQRPLQIVIDPLETRDFNAGTDVLVQVTPQAFFEGLQQATDLQEANSSASAQQKSYLAQWQSAEAKARMSADSIIKADAAIEGACVRAIARQLQPDSLLFAANSMAIRWVDTFAHNISATILCNRGLNGIDGTLSTALGAAQDFQHAVFLTGDLTLLHDISAFAMQRELLVAQAAAGHEVPHMVIVLLNNHGGGIFDMLPQKSEDAYFERLFLTPQQIDFSHIAAAFDVPYAQVRNAQAFEMQLAAFLENKGISLIEVTVPLSGVRERLV